MAVDYLFEVTDYAPAAQGRRVRLTEATRRSPSVVYWFVLLTLAVTVAAFAPGTSSRSTVRFTSPATSRAVLRRRCPPRRVTAPGKTGDVPRALL